jgi:regulator of protease activity HflC (stomatin/prohibitin superfamily)
MKSLFRLQNIAMLMDFSSTSAHKPSHDDMKKVFTEDEVKQSEFYKTLDSWGATPKSFSVSDIEIPDSIKIERERVFKAEKDLAIADIEISTAQKKAEKDLAVSVIEIKTADKKAKKIIIEATANSEKTALEGKGESKKLRAIVDDSGLKKEDVSGYLLGLAKWEALGNNANVTIIEDSSNGASSGARFGAGFNSSNKPRQNNPQNQNQTQNQPQTQTPKTK